MSLKSDTSTFNVSISEISTRNASMLRAYKECHVTDSPRTVRPDEKSFGVGLFCLHRHFTTISSVAVLFHGYYKKNDKYRRLEYNLFLSQV